MVPKLKGNQAFADSSDDLPSPVRKIQKLHWTQFSVNAIRMLKLTGTLLLQFLCDAFVY
jgi:hypothetical protein